MARHKQHEEHENHERWLISYADFITLLFAFFVVMFASSQADKNKAKAVADSMTQAFEGRAPAKKVAEILGGTPDDKGKGNAAMKGPGGTEVKGPPQELSESLQKLLKDLKHEIESGKIHVSMETRGLVITLQEAAFFPSGESSLLPAALPSVAKIAYVVARLPNKIRLEGHTDSIPIRNDRFRNNWTLSSARGIAVLEWLESRYHIPAARMAVVSYADTVAKAGNDTEEGRARNRRVDITILNEHGVKEEAATASIKTARLRE